MRREQPVPAIANASRGHGADLKMSVVEAVLAEEGARPPSGASAVVLSGFYEGLEVDLNQSRTVIGRGRKADLALAEATISRAHAVIVFDGADFFVEDLGSTNGTLVNGERVTRRPLASEDEIQMGTLRIGVTLPA